MSIQIEARLKMTVDNHKLKINSARTQLITYCTVPLPNGKILLLINFIKPEWKIHRLLQ